MRLRTVAAAAVLGAVLTFPLAGVAAAQDRDCADFPTQAEAQAVYELNRADPYGLDRDEDGTACETLPGGIVGGAEGPRPTGDAGAPPAGGVETGAGGTAPGGSDDGLPGGPELLAPVLAGGAALAVGGVVLARRRAARRSD